MKKTFILIICSFLLFSSLYQVFAESGVAQNAKYKIYIDKKLVIFESQPIISNNKLMFPLDEFLKSLGVSKENIEYRYYDNRFVSVSILYGTRSISIDTLSTSVWVSYGDSVTLDAKPLISKDKMYVPIESFSKLLDKSVTIDNKNYKIYISDIIMPEPRGWLRLKNRPSGNEPVKIEIKSSISGFGVIGFTTDDMNKAVSINNKIYMIDNNGTLKEYNITSDVWTDKAKIKELKNSRGVFKLAVLKGKILIIGVNYSDIFQYDVKTNKCKLLTKLPAKRVIGSVVVAEGNLYILSGTEMGSPNTLDTLDVYNPSTNKWLSKEGMFEGSNELVSVYYNGKIYIFGAVSDGEFDGQNIEAYDIKTDTWSYIKPPDNGTWYASGVQECNGKLYVFGDEFDENYHAKYSVKLYDPVNDKWTKVADMLPKHFGYMTCTLNGDIYIVDGKTVEKYMPNKT